MNSDNINKLLVEDLDSSSDYDDSFLNPDYKNDDLSDGNISGILCFESDNESEPSTTNLNAINVIEATDSSSNDENPQVSKGKKRTVNTSNWKRNIAKRRKNTGVEYVSRFSNKLVLKRKTVLIVNASGNVFRKLLTRKKLLFLRNLTQ